MTDLESLDQKQWNPLFFLGIDNQFVKINANTVLNTWVVIALIIFLILFYRYVLHKKYPVIRYATKSFVAAFIDLIEQNLGYFQYTHFAFITSLFIFIVFCNCIGIVPWTIEPTTDINTTLALGLVAFIYKETQGIKAHGVWGYFKELFNPIFLMFPINVIGHYSKIISISFRLFGNIFGGSIITEFYKTAIGYSWITQLIGLFSGVNIVIMLFFGLFEGFIQAFVFSMLTLTYISLATQSESES